MLLFFSKLLEGKSFNEVYISTAKPQRYAPFHNLLSRFRDNAQMLTSTSIVGNPCMLTKKKLNANTSHLLSAKVQSENMLIEKRVSLL